jgi:hypothetical protein
MAGRIRTIKPEWLEDENLLLASCAARVLSVALILESDDHGRGRGSPFILIPRIFPRHSAEGFEGYFELAGLKFFSIYEVRGQIYFEITNWGKHQKVDKPGKPRVPERCEGFDLNPESLLEEYRGFSEFSRLTTTTTTTNDHDRDHDQDPEKDHDHDLSLVVEWGLTTAMVETVYRSYPVKKGKSKGVRRVMSAIKTEPDFERFRDCVSFMAKAFAGDATFCPHFSTFANGAMWRDEDWPAPSKSSSGGVVSPSSFLDGIDDD